MSRYHSRSPFKFGNRRDNTLEGSEDRDFIFGFSGDDALSGAGGNDILSGGRGEDTLAGGSGSDLVFGGSGRDLLIYEASENVGARDYYNGGSGNDTLQLNLTQEIWFDPAFQVELAAFLIVFDSQQKNHHGHHGGRSNFTFDSLGLTVTRIEDLVIFVDGIEVSPTDDPVTALSDAASVAEGDIEVGGNVLENDSVPDLVADLSVISTPTHGTVTLGANGAYLFTLDNAAPEVNGLSEGETLVDSFAYEVTDANGDSATATVEITITGQNDAPTAIAGTLIAHEDDAAQNLDLATLFNDVDSEDDGSTPTYTATVPGGSGTVQIDGAMLTFVPGVDFQALNDGETRDVMISVIGIDLRGAAVSTDVTVTVTGSDDNTAPTFLYTPGTQPTASAGNLVLDGSNDLSVWFSDADGDALTFTAADLPDGLVLGADGVLSIDATSNVISLVGQDITITATDAMGAATSVTLTLTAALNNDFGIGFAQGVSAVVTGSSLIDTISFGSDAGRFGVLTANGGDGNDTIRFGKDAGDSGLVTANGGNGDDTFIFGSQAALSYGRVVVNGEEGNDTFSFGGTAGHIYGVVIADGGVGDDVINFNGWAGYNGGDITATGGDGDDTLSFGDSSGASEGRLIASGNNGDDTISFGNRTGVGGEVTTNGGAGSDTISFTDMAGANDGSVTAHGGAGDDSISFGAAAGMRDATITVNGGDGADTIRFGTNAQNLTIDLGAADNAVDTLIFDGTVRNATVANWDGDTITVDAPINWSGQENGTNTVFTNLVDGSDFTLLGVTGVALDDILPGMNHAPEFIGASTVLLNAEAGTEATAYAPQDLAALFTDTDGGQTLSFTATGLPDGFALSTDGVLTQIDPTAIGAVGDQTLVLTATDSAGAATSVDLTLTAAMDNDFGFGFAVGASAAVTGSSLADTILFGGEAAADNGILSVDGGDGDDTIAFEYQAAYEGGQITVEGGAGNDDIAFGHYPAERANIVANGGTGDDTISFIRNAATGGGRITANGGTGDDVFELGTSAARNTGVMVLSGGAGHDNFDFGSFAANEDGVITVDGGDGNDIFALRANAANNGGQITVDGGAGNDLIQIGTDAGAFGGQITINGGDGADTFQISERAANLIIDLGANDNAVDRLQFDGSFPSIAPLVRNTVVSHWDGDIIVVSAPFSWVGSDNGTDTVFTNLVDGSDFTLLGVTGVAIEDIVSGVVQAPQAGSGASAYSQDFSGLPEFSPSPGNVVVYTATGLPDGFILTDAGTLTQTDPTRLSAVGTHTVQITATMNGTLSSAPVAVTLTVAMNHDFGNRFASSSADTVNGSDVADTMIFGDEIAERSALIATGGDGNDAFSFGRDTGGYTGLITANGGNGDDTFTFGMQAAVSNGQVVVNGDNGDDTMSFATFAGHIYGIVTANGGVGDDTISFGDRAGGAYGVITASGGDGNDVISFGGRAGDASEVTANGGAGSDTISFGAEAGRYAGRVIANGGAGADTVRFGTDAQNLTIDLGAADGDIDTLIFEGAVTNATVANWEQGVDLVYIVNATLWTGTDNGTDTVFTLGTNSITFEDVTGVDVDSFLF